MTDISGIWSTIQRDMWQDTGLNGDAQRIEQLGWMLFFKIFSDKDQELELIDDNYKSPIPPELHWDQWAGDDEGMTGEELQVFVDRTLFPALRNIPVVNNKRALILREVFEGNNNYMKSGINIRKVLNKLNEIDFNIKDDRHAFGDVYEGVLKNLQSAGKSGEFYTPRAITQFITEMVDPQIGEKVLDPSCGTGGFLTNAIEHLRKGNTNIETLKAIQDNVIGWEYKPLPYLLATTNLILHDVEVPNITFRDALDQPLTNYTEKDRVNVIIANPPFGGIVANNNETNFPQNFRSRESADLFLILMIHLLKMEGRAGIVLPDGSLTGEGVKLRVRERLLNECNLHTIIRLPNSVFQPYATVATNLLFFTKGTATKDIWYYEHRLPSGQKSYNKTKPIRVEEFHPIREWWNNRAESEVCWKVNIDTIQERGYDMLVKNPNAQDRPEQLTSTELIQTIETSLLQNVELLRKIQNEING
ncbi:MAG TPA: N-6 DNA methylase [Pyrinomonadaceae bacterium]|nr:N-6 DNA methylase [Pyrinomonadaceae bacterium]